MAPLAADISLYVFIFNLSRIKSHIAVINTFIRYRHPYLRERTLTRSTTPAARPLSVKQTEPAPIRFMVTIITLIYFFIAVYNYVIVCHFFSLSLLHTVQRKLSILLSVAAAAEIPVWKRGDVTNALTLSHLQTGMSCVCDHYFVVRSVFRFLFFFWSAWDRGTLSRCYSWNEVTRQRPKWAVTAVQHQQKERERERGCLLTARCVKSCSTPNIRAFQFNLRVEVGGLARLGEVDGDYTRNTSAD